MRLPQLQQELIDIAFQEDVNDGDITSIACIDENAVQKAKIIAKDEGVIAGVNLAEQLFLDHALRAAVHKNFTDGDYVHHGDTIMTIEGNAIALLSTERIALNFMQRMSGIATRTYQAVKKIKHTNTKLLDTRKTTPGLRSFEKDAVKAGGGYNHRMGLYDVMMIKDNHIDYAGGINEAITKANKYINRHNKEIRIIIEVRNEKELIEVLQTGHVNRILLDNFQPEELKKAVQKINKKFETEASGGINLNTIEDYAATDVDFVSMGSITHSADNFDISMVADKH